LKDTNEFAHIDTRPVRYTVWSNGKYIEVDPSQETPAPQPPRKKAKVDEDAVNGEEKPAEEEQKAAAPAVKKPRVKKWLEKGLYAGQEAPLDIFKGLNAQEKKKLAALPELLPSGKPNHTFPQPMYNGLRVLINGRDFKLPFDVCNPLPPGQPKPAAYRTMTKSEFLCQPDGII
jgi:histone-lysine N-methyltransferase ASH1L